MPTIYPNTSNKNRDIAFLFNIVERSGNYIFEDETPPTSLRERVVINALGAHKVVIESSVVET
jgi:hypothetical protein